MANIRVPLPPGVVHTGFVGVVNPIIKLTRLRSMITTDIVRTNLWAQLFTFNSPMPEIRSKLLMIIPIINGKIYLF